MPVPSPEKRSLQEIGRSLYFKVMFKTRSFYWIVLTLALLSINNLIAYSYQGPTTAVPGNPKFVRVQVLVRDSPEAGGVQVQSAEFDGKTIPLKPRDIYGNRGGAGFQVSPGKYKLKWTVQKDRLIWPRLMKHEEIVEISPRDLWIQIEIIGNDASIR